MPLDMYCENCRLIFSVGWSHSPIERIWRFKLVCRACGTVYDYQEPIESDRPVALRVQPGPLFLVEKPQGIFVDWKDWIQCELSTPLLATLNAHRISAQVKNTQHLQSEFGKHLDQHLLDMMRKPDTSCLSPDLQLQLDRCLSEESVDVLFARMSCSHCGRTGALSSDWDERNTTCPACGKQSLFEHCNYTSL